MSVWCLELSVGCLDLSSGCLDLSFGCLDLSFECLDLSFGCLGLSFGCLVFWVPEGGCLDLTCWYSVAVEPCLGGASDVATMLSGCSTPNPYPKTDWERPDDGRRWSDGGGRTTDWIGRWPWGAPQAVGEAALAADLFSKHPKDNSKHPKDNSKHPKDKSKHPKTSPSTQKTNPSTQKTNPSTQKTIPSTQLTSPGTRPQKILKND